MHSSAVSIIPLYFEIGDHRAFVVNFSIEEILGDKFVPMYKVDMRRLISCQLSSIANYILRAKELFDQYWILEKLQQLRTD